MERLEPPVFQQPGQEAHAEAPHLGQGLTHRREMGRDELGLVGVVEADDRQIAWNP
jgi:hypothetical protein